jgi:hypothetical protein
MAPNAKGLHCLALGACEGGQGDALSIQVLCGTHPPDHGFTLRATTRKQRGGLGTQIALLPPDRVACEAKRCANYPVTAVALSREFDCTGRRPGVVTFRAECGGPGGQAGGIRAGVSAGASWLSTARSPRWCSADSLLR